DMFREFESGGASGSGGRDDDEEGGNDEDDDGESFPSGDSPATCRWGNLSPATCRLGKGQNVAKEDVKCCSDSDRMKTKVNFQSLEFDVGNVEADLVISMASVQEVNVGFMNSLYGYFIGKRIAYSLVEQCAWNKWCLWVKLHNVPMVSFTSDRLSMIATKLSNPITLDSYMSSMCMEYFARDNFAHALIDLEATCGLKDKLVVAIPKLEDSGYSMETIRVEYE
ncbi:hypothetical protein Tco_1248907, partial [Tanacetum coccineum]